MLDGTFEDGAVEVAVPFDVTGIGPGWQIRFHNGPVLSVGSRLGASVQVSFCRLKSSSTHPVLDPVLDPVLSPVLLVPCLDLVDLPSFTIAARSPLFVGVAPAGTPPAQVPMTAVADLDGSGSTATLDTASLSPGEYVVAARICYDVCATGSTTITI